MVEGMSLLGMHPDRTGRRIVAAVARNRALLPLRAESWLVYRLTSACPASAGSPWG
ncbi:hypothetical protein [Nocardia sp. NPDC004860]|uniref:hypothetical protein n=1 Tax=Nocardia sp. NPDC004860 TaxID=3154557 RepID=UPI0033B9147C